MAVRADKYRPLLFSERIAGVNIDDDPELEFTLCRAAALAMGFDCATLGEWTTNPNGTRWGRARITAALHRMRFATGDPQRPGYNQTHMDDFLRGVGAPVEAYQVFNRPMADIKKALSEGWVIFLAGDVKHTPLGSPLRRYVNGNVGHEIIVTRISKDGEKFAFIDPMTPHGTARYERWAPIGHFRQFGSEFRSGKNYNAGRMKRGRYTREKIVTRNRAATILDLQTRILALSRDLKVQQNEIEMLNLELEQCTAAGNCDDVRDKLSRIDSIVHE